MKNFRNFYAWKMFLHINIKKVETNVKKNPKHMIKKEKKLKANKICKNN